MKKFLIVFPYLINLFFVNPLSIQPSYSAEVNCNSPVWKNKPLCLKKQKKNREAKECLLQKNNNLEIKTYKGTNLFKSIKCLPIEEKIVFINKKGQKKYILISRYKSLFGSTYLVFENQAAFYVHFTMPHGGYAFRTIAIDGEELELNPKNISPYTNKYVLNKSVVRAFKNLDNSFELALDPGFIKWSVVREIPVINNYFLAKKSEWKTRSEALLNRDLPKVLISKEPKDGSQIFKNSIESLVTIELGGGSSGSGFFIDDDLVATNSHVVSGAKSISVITYDKGSYEGEVVYDDELYDFALVKINPKNKYKSLPVCRNSSLKTGDPVFVLGSPGAAIVEKGYLENSITGGLVSSVRFVDEQLFIQTDAAMNPGNSGGPLLNKYGAVVGISTFVLSDQRIQGIYFAGEISNILAESGLIKIDNSYDDDFCGLEIIKSNFFENLFNFKN
mgnify:CR=1 FL=1